MCGCISERDLLSAAKKNIMNTPPEGREDVVRAYKALRVFSDGFLEMCVREARERAEESKVDLEETYYKVEYTFRDHGYDVTLLDEALDENEEGANEFLTRVAQGEDVMQLASEYYFIEE